MHSVQKDPETWNLLAYHCTTEPPVTLLNLYLKSYPEPAALTHQVEWVSFMLKATAGSRITSCVPFLPALSLHAVCQKGSKCPKQF